jgi:hypothetical protein
MANTNMRIVTASLVCPYQGSHDDHGGTGGAYEAREYGTQQKHARIAGGGSVQIAGHQDAPGYHVEREQERNEAHVVKERSMQKRVERRRGPERERDRPDRKSRPAGGNLAVMARPESRKQEGSGCNRGQDANEWQGPRPGQVCTIEENRGAGLRRHECEAGSERSASGADRRGHIALSHQRLLPSPA